MKATISWRKIGGWLIELGGEKPAPIRELINPESLQKTLREWWPNCRVTYDERDWPELVIRDAPCTDIQAVLTYLKRTYWTHPITADTIVWGIGETVD